MDPISHTLAASSPAQAAPRVRVYADRKGRRCGLIVGMAVFFAVLLFLIAAYMAVGLTWQIVRLLTDPDPYRYYSPDWRDKLAMWSIPSAILLGGLSGGMWLISAARTYSRYVRGVGEVHQLALLLKELRSKSTDKQRGPSNANHV